MQQTVNYKCDKLKSSEHVVMFSQRDCPANQVFYSFLRQGAQSFSDAICVLLMPIKVFNSRKKT